MSNPFFILLQLGPAQRDRVHMPGYLNLYIQVLSIPPSQCKDHSLQLGLYTPACHCHWEMGRWIGSVSQEIKLGHLSRNFKVPGIKNMAYKREWGTQVIPSPWPHGYRNLRGEYSYESSKVGGSEVRDPGEKPQVSESNSGADFLSWKLVL